MAKAEKEETKKTRKPHTKPVYNRDKFLEVFGKKLAKKGIALSEKDVTKVAEAYERTIYNQIMHEDRRDGDVVLVADLIKVKISTRKERLRRNPRSGEMIAKGACRSVRAAVTPSFRKEIDETFRKNPSKDLKAQEEETNKVKTKSDKKDKKVKKSKKTDEDDE